MALNIEENLQRAVLSFSLWILVPTVRNLDSIILTTRVTQVGIVMGYLIVKMAGLR
jgi:hypothetical protein